MLQGKAIAQLRTLPQMLLPSTFPLVKQLVKTSRRFQVRFVCTHCWLFVFVTGFRHRNWHWSAVPKTLSSANQHSAITVSLPEHRVAVSLQPQLAGSPTRAAPLLPVLPPMQPPDRSAFLDAGEATLAPPAPPVVSPPQACSCPLPDMASLIHVLLLPSTNAGKVLVQCESFDRHSDGTQGAICLHGLRMSFFLQLRW